MILAASEEGLSMSLNVGLHKRAKLNSLDNVSISFVKCCTNGVAHLLVRYSISKAERKEWFHEPPCFICNTLHFDLNEWFGFIYNKKKIDLDLKVPSSEQPTPSM